MTTDVGHLLSDHALVSEAQAGDPHALNTLISAVRSAVIRYSRSRLGAYAGGAEAAEDVTQDTCVAVVNVLPRYEPQGAPFAAFVYAIAANKVADAQRRFARAVVCVDDLPDQVESAPTPEEHVMATVNVEAAMALLQQLPPKMRQVVRLRAMGLSAECVGETLGMSANAVRVTQHRATVKLRALIAASEEHLELFGPAVRRLPPAA